MTATIMPSLCGVVFDFFGTLTDPDEEENRRAVYDATAVALGVPTDEFWTKVTASFTERATGVCGGTRTTLQAIAQRCGAEPTEQQLDRAVETHHEGARRLHTARPGAIDLVRGLRARGFRLALLSDCSSELCELWPSTPFAEHFEATVFSWAEGYRKPDPRGFAKAARLLGLHPQDCWFVGDGGSGELTGALAAGMRPVLVTNAAYPRHAQYRDNADAFVPGDTVDEITDLLDLIGEPAEAGQ